MLELKFIVAERDVDLLILEELEVSESFRSWFAARVFEIPLYRASVGAWHSVTDPELGESDVVFIFHANDDSRKAVLIENKIDAPPQSEQGQRYRKRGERGIEDGNWDEYRTCIVAPKRYLSSVKHSEIYDVEVSYEELVAYFAATATQNQRSEYRAKFVLEGIEQNRRGYQPKISPEMTDFVKHYASFANESFPQLHVEVPKPRPAGSTWIVFKPEGVPKGASVVHQLTAGFVKIMLRGKAHQVDDYTDKYSHSIDGLEIGKAGKSLGFSMVVDRIDPLRETFDECKDKARAALDTLQRMISSIRSRGDF